MKDFRKTANWKKFTENWPEKLTDTILICSVDNLGLPEEEYTVAYLDVEDGQVGVNVFGYTYFQDDEDEFQKHDLDEYIWDYLD